MGVACLARGWCPPALNVPGCPIVLVSQSRVAQKLQIWPLGTSEGIELRSLFWYRREAATGSRDEIQGDLSFSHLHYPDGLDPGLRLLRILSGIHIQF